MTDMKLLQDMLSQGRTNFVFIGEAGCGKSEIALNFAQKAAKAAGKPVHFFDMDMTKPLFRSRDVFGADGFDGITFHYEEQFYDAPTLVGGVRELMRDPDNLVVLDVGGDDIGARSIGGFMLGPNRSNTSIFYVLNVYRPLCRDLDHIDQILGEILAVSHIRVDELHLIHNPNLGVETTVQEVIDGAGRMAEILEGIGDIELTCVKEDLAEQAEGRVGTEVLPIKLYLTYPWLQ